MRRYWNSRKVKKAKSYLQAQWEIQLHSQGMVLFLNSFFQDNHLIVRRRHNRFLVLSDMGHNCSPNPSGCAPAGAKPLAGLPPQGSFHEKGSPIMGLLYFYTQNAILWVVDAP